MTNKDPDIKYATRTVSVPDSQGQLHRIIAGNGVRVGSPLWEAMTDDQRKTFADPTPEPEVAEDFGDFFDGSATGFDGPTSSSSSPTSDSGQTEAKSGPFPGTGSTIETILAWVGGDPIRASVAYEAEGDAEKPRPTLLGQLQPIVDGQAPE